MNNFDALHPRNGGTGADRTRFTDRRYSDSGLTLAGGRRLDLPPVNYRGAFASQPNVRPADWPNFGEYEALDHAVQTVTGGPLSRGMSRRESRDAVALWHGYAVGQPDEPQAEFAAGIRSGVVALFERRMPWYKAGTDRFDLDSGASPALMQSALDRCAAASRTSRDDLEHWRRLLQHAPSEAWQRGHLAAGIILSGADDWWGMRQDPDAAILGPAAHIPV